MRIIIANESFSSINYKHGTGILRKFWVSVVVIIFIYLVVLFCLEPQRYYWLVILGAIFLFLYVFKNKDYREAIQQIKKWRKGADGEKEVQALLKNNLNDNYTLITNFTPQDVYIGDIDCILVGPKGLYILEVKKWGGKFSIFYTMIFRHLFGNHYFLYKNIFKQIDSQVSSLSRYLTEKNIKVLPIPMLVLVEGKVDNIVGRPGIYVCEVRKLLDHLSSLKNNPEFTNEFCDKICSAFPNKN